MKGRTSYEVTHWSHLGGFLHKAVTVATPEKPAADTSAFRNDGHGLTGKGCSAPEGYHQDQPNSILRTLRCANFPLSLQ